MSLHKDRLFLLYSLLYFLFLLSYSLDLPFVPLISGISILLFFPGLILLRNKNLFFSLTVSPAISTAFFTVITIILNIVFRIRFDNLFLPLLFASVFPVFLFKRKSSPVNLSRNEVLVIAIFFLAIFIHLIILIKCNFQLVGTDISRFATISKIQFLNGFITPNGGEYDFYEGFFYFPFIFVFPILLQLLGLNPVHGITLITFVLEVFSILAFSLFANNFLKGRKMVFSVFFYAFFFNLSFDFMMFRGLSPFSTAFYFSILAASFIFSKSDYLPFFFSLLGCFLTHWYQLLAVGVVYACSVGYDFVFRNYFDFKFFKRLLTHGLVILLLSSPFLILFGEYAFIKFDNKTIVEHYGMSKQMFSSSLSFVFLSFINSNSSFTVLSNIFYSVAFVVSLLALRYFRKASVFFILLIMLNFVISISLSGSLTFRRVTDFSKFYYPIGLSAYFGDFVSGGILTFFSGFSQGSQFWFLLNPTKVWLDELGFVDVVGDEELRAFEFVKNSLPEDAVIMLDGGGGSCFSGIIGSHGDRIFPITGRKVFLFTNFCSGVYDSLEMERRTNLYNSLAINTTNGEVLETLKKEYNVSHIYLGPGALGLKPGNLDNDYYKLLWNESETFVYKIL